MTDLLGVYVLAIFLPTILLILCMSALAWLWGLLYQRNQRTFNWRVAPRALVATLAVETFFLLVGGAILALVAGKALGYGFLAVVVALTMLVGLIGGICFVLLGVPNWLTWHQTQKHP